MAQSSSIITGGATISVATLVPIINWALGGFHAPIPDSVPWIISAAIITGCHALYNHYSGTATSAATADLIIPEKEPK